MLALTNVSNWSFAALNAIRGKAILRSQQAWTLEELTMNELIDPAEKAYVEARNSVSDDELLARIKNAPDCGGSLLVELSEFVEQRS